MRSVSADGLVEIIETVPKNERDRDRRVPLSQLELIERGGVNVFNLNDEPELVKLSHYDWIVNVTVADKRILNAIVSKIQIRHTHMSLVNESTKKPDPLSTVEGSLAISMIETKGLILSSEMNRKKENRDLRIDPLVELKLIRFSGEELEGRQLQKVENKREVFWGKNSKSKGSIKEEVV